MANSLKELHHDVNIYNLKHAVDALVTNTDPELTDQMQRIAAMDAIAPFCEFGTPFGQRSTVGRLASELHSELIMISGRWEVERGL